MIHPTCSSTEDGPCPYTPLAGVDTCLRHTRQGDRVQFGGLIRDGQRPDTPAAGVWASDYLATREAS
ncbi:hypothetical protein [Amycolatopsis sp. NPDC001319]|uniref:hypothetical protein n=1 Tax=unclassified Amycolatopsis TaxID=2618356 RepID=UPI0036B5BF52